ncbi:MAG: hypothetical protein H5U40_17895 [Polyangiaceae bacterium]|nr:hypothetical protein [Polyangiaceae bacterium]
MIIVTGTKRSGTSMWMQILKAAGLEPLGSAFPKDWGETIREANPEGFYESIFRDGIYYRTNPNPKTGVFLFPAATKERSVKVFVPGVIRSDLAFIDKVIATMRNWREYPGSVSRLYAMEQSNRSKKRDYELPEAAHVPPVLEWWAENHALLSDVLTRRYPVHFVAYETVLTKPVETIEEVIGWLGIGDATQAIAAVKPTLRTHEASTLEPPQGVSPAHAEVFDELYARVRDRRGLDEAFIDRLNAVNDELAPAVEAAAQKVAKARALRRKLLREAKAKRAAELGAGDRADQKQRSSKRTAS